MEMVFCIQFKDQTCYPRFEDTYGSIVSDYLDLKILFLICSLQFPCAVLWIELSRYHRSDRFGVVHRDT